MATTHSTVPMGATHLTMSATTSAATTTSSSTTMNKAPTASLSSPNGPSSAVSGRFLRALSSLSSLTSSSMLSSLSASGPSAQAEGVQKQLTLIWTSTKPWAEFMNTKKMGSPSSPAELQERLTDNLAYFGNNYIICFLFIACLSVLIHPLSFISLLVIGALYVALFLQNMDLGPVKLSRNAKFVVFGSISFVLLYVTNAIGIIGSWALSTVILSLLHAALRVSAREPDFDSPVNSV